MNSRGEQTFVERWRSDPANSGERVWAAIDRPGGLGLALVVANLLRPHFIEVCGHVVLAENYDEGTFEKWRQRLGGATPRVEEMVNLVNIADLFLNDSEATSSDLDALARSMRQGWSETLAEKFPGRHFTVEMTSTEDSDDGPDITAFSIIVEEEGKSNSSNGF
ncbi:conserved hypothetical protein [Frankia sp. AiPs1]|uniref:hypothetical protein n=1 Tax=Frankia sp. AiPa1 TaxID=573492 RepID=UPI00202B22B6|nr:hypothetical protein [Frankia sp. AiPa1]MCL9758972.1 hypothetical protein [Frankia sp. AiPa1]